MTVSSIIVLFATMIVLAAAPSVSVLTVSARAAAYGFLHGVLASLGIVAADVLFIIIAIYGLSFLASSLGDWFDLIKYVGAAYLIFLGIVLFRLKTVAANAKGVSGSSSKASFMAGFLITLADQKAILFYLGFLPAFLDLSSVTIVDTGIIVLVATVSIMTAKLGYAYLGDRVGTHFKSVDIIKIINRIAGGIMIAVAVFVLVSA